MEFKLIGCGEDDEGCDYVCELATGFTFVIHDDPHETTLLIHDQEFKVIFFGYVDDVEAGKLKASDVAVKERLI